jgi:hypothetical protein
VLLEGVEKASAYEVIWGQWRVVMASHQNFSATDSALGYLYQFRLALWSSLQKCRKNKSFSVYLETLDDVVFESNDFSVELLQLKHHRNHAENLSDSSSDLWKSFRVWIEGRTNNSIPGDAQLYLITTSKISAKSLASYLTLEDRNEAEALKKLQKIASTSTTKKNEISYKLFKNLSSHEQATLLRSITILSEMPNIKEVDRFLRDEVRFVVKRNYLESFLTRLEGWWYRRVINQLTSPEKSPIFSDEIESKLDELREQFKNESLTIDEDIFDAEIESALYDSLVFVQQVKLAGIGKQRIFFAIRDYYRAFQQRSRWIREELILMGDLHKYERRLQEAWEYEFARIADEIGDEVSEQIKKEAAQRIYNWMEDCDYPIRPQITEPSIKRGSFHILADRLRVGWHPEFRQRLQKILELQGVL